jgi:PAT family beta-lactamase induction signal transducer AmpG
MHTVTATTQSPAKRASPWLWIPSLYFGQAIPYVVVMSLSVAMYKNIGISNADIAFYTSLLYLPWVVKPLWAPFVDMFRTKRFWILALQLSIGVAFALIALTTRLPSFFAISIGLFWIMAFASATHDIAADGFYLFAMPQHQQAAYVGVRSLFYRVATIVAGGLLLLLAGLVGTRTGDILLGWSVAMSLLAILFGAMFAYHHWALPRPPTDLAVRHSGNHVQNYFAAFAAFFRKKDILVILGFILTFRLGESQLVKLVVPFLLDPQAKGGLGLSTVQVGFVYGTVGIGALTLGGLLGGYVISRFGLRRCLWPMVFAIHLPDLMFVYLASALPQDIGLVSLCIAIEQFGYGLGFTAFMMYLIKAADGEHKTAHYAICTGFMALGMMLPGMASGWIQERLGYQDFFIWVCLATLPAFLMATRVKIDAQFGMKPADAGKA